MISRWYGDNSFNSGILSAGDVGGRALLAASWANLKYLRRWV